jgi:hypothetical protein
VAHAAQVVLLKQGDVYDVGTRSRTDLVRLGVLAARIASAPELSLNSERRPHPCRGREG